LCASVSLQDTFRESLVGLTVGIEAWNRVKLLERLATFKFVRNMFETRVSVLHAFPSCVATCAKKAIL
jgi:hypothetical protein